MFLREIRVFFRTIQAMGQAGNLGRGAYLPRAIVPIGVATRVKAA
jgi:hypothetical protein